MKPVFVGRQLARRSFGEDSNDLSGDVTCTSSPTLELSNTATGSISAAVPVRKISSAVRGSSGGYLGLVNGEAQLVTCEFYGRSSG